MGVVVLLTAGSTGAAGPILGGDETRIMIEGEAGVPDEITFDIRSRRGLIEIEGHDLAIEYDFDLDDVDAEPGFVTLGPELTISDGGLQAGDRFFPVGDLRVQSIEEYGHRHVRVTLRPRRRGADRPRGRFSAGRDLEVDPEDFVRGDVICFGGRVNVMGEVNRNVVAFFGSVHVERDGVVRGDVVAAGGSVYVLDDGVVEGEIISRHVICEDDGWVRVWSPDFRAEMAGTGSASYNRVDGGYLDLGLLLADADSLLPSLHGQIGYAFMAKRGRYAVGVRQKFFKHYSFNLGGSYFRKTSSDDDWISSTEETSCLAFLAAEDFRDYYEEEGGRAYLTFDPGEANQLGVGYRYTELSWMDHHPQLWSLFGWDKEFRENFSSVPLEVRRDHRSDFSGHLGEASAWYALDTRDDEEETRSGWWARFEGQTSGGRTKGHFDYQRFIGEIRRYQPITDVQNLNVRVRYGTSGGQLPLFRKFYLGGMRTIRGLEHKSMMGDQMVLGNIEYVLRFLREDFALSLLFDVGTVGGNREDIFADADLSSSIGFRIALGEDVYAEVAKSLGDADASPKGWLLFEKSF